MSWRFCGISMTYIASKLEIVISPNFLLSKTAPSRRRPVWTRSREQMKPCMHISADFVFPKEKISGTTLAARSAADTLHDALDKPN
jgi:hypothetical protein